MDLIAVKSKAGYGVGWPVLRVRPERRDLSANATRPMRTLEETTSLA